MDAILLKSESQLTEHTQHERTQGLNIDDTLLALNSRSQPTCTAAVELITGMDTEQFRNVFLKGAKTCTLQSLAECVEALPWDSQHCRMLLQLNLDSNLKQKDLSESGIYSKVSTMCLHASAATAVLAQKVVQKQKPGSLPLMPSFETAISSLKGIKKRKKKSKISLKRNFVCLVCKQFCKEPDSVKTAWCSGCMRATHCSCCTLSGLTLTYPDGPAEQGCICCADCQHIAAASKELVTATAQQNFMPLTALSQHFPGNLAMTTTAGGQYLSDAQAEIILPAAIGLLPESNMTFGHYDHMGT
ncbi:hypothetical protein ABBQ32_011101 [Trebouxia sp. C0010 RCD-2024]